MDKSDFKLSLGLVLDFNRRLAFSGLLSQYHLVQPATPISTFYQACPNIETS